MKHEKEIRRQLVHMSGILLLPLVFVFGGATVGGFSFLFSIGIFIYSEYIARKHKIRKVIKSKKLEPFRKKEDRFHRFINIFERSRNNYRGAFYFYFSSGIVLISFSPDAAMLSIAVLAIGDSFATLVGIYGKRKIFFNPDKTWEGFFACFFSSFLFCLIINPVLAFPAALVGTLVESAPTKLDDNLTIPLITAVVLMFF